VAIKKLCRSKSGRDKPKTKTMKSNTALKNEAPPIPPQISSIIEEAGKLRGWVENYIDADPVKAGLAATEKKVAEVLALDLSVEERAARYVQLGAEVVVLKSDLGRMPERRLEAGKKAFDFVSRSLPAVVAWAWGFHGRARREVVGRIEAALADGLKAGGVPVGEAELAGVRKQAEGMADEDAMVKHWKAFGEKVSGSLRLSKEQEQPLPFASVAQEKWAWFLNPVSPLANFSQLIQPAFEEAVNNMPPPVV
jgi:hypothetical protein